MPGVPPSRVHVKRIQELEMLLQFIGKWIKWLKDVLRRRRVKNPFIIFHVKTSETTIQRCSEIKVFRQWTCEKL